ncbi:MULTISPECIES: hypothetical protein [unclassified Arthrobacter]|nr:MULTISPECIES: hypothetical protein [unclassified Arthrobacter]
MMSFHGSGKMDIMARDSAGDLRLYAGNGTPRWPSGSKARTGWNAMIAIL